MVDKGEFGEKQSAPGIVISSPFEKGEYVCDLENLLCSSLPCGCDTTHRRKGTGGGICINLPSRHTQLPWFSGKMDNFGLKRKKIADEEKD